MLVLATNLSVPPTILNFIIIRPAGLEIKHTDGHSESCSFFANNSQTCEIRSTKLHYRLKSSALISRSLL